MNVYQKWLRAAERPCLAVAFVSGAVWVAVILGVQIDEKASTAALWCGGSLLGWAIAGVLSRVPQNG